jgi:hypothetical protein
MAEKIHVMVLLVITLYSDVEGYQRFGGPCCLHLQGEMNGTGKVCIHTGSKYKRGRPAVGKEQGGVPYQTATGRSRPGRVQFSLTGAGLDDRQSFYGPTSSE